MWNFFCACIFKLFYWYMTHAAYLYSLKWHINDKLNSRCLKLQVNIIWDATHEELLYTDPASEISGSPEGGGFHPPPIWKTHFGVSDPNYFLHSQVYIYKELRPKTLDFVTYQSSAPNLTYSSKFWKLKIYKGKSSANFFGGPPKINRFGF